MNETARVTAGIIGVPLLGTLLLIVYLTPRYIPGDALARAAVEAGAGLPGREAVARTLRACRQGVEFSPERLAAGSTRIYSWENDRGLIAVTDLGCAEGGTCTVSQRALLPRPAGTRIWECWRYGRRASWVYEPPV